MSSNTYANADAMWKMRNPTDEEVAARFAEDELYGIFEERSGDRFIEWLGPSMPSMDEFLLLAAGAMSVAGMSDGEGVSLVRTGGKRNGTVGLYLEE